MNTKFSASLASIALAASLILSCSDSGDDSNSSSLTEKHKIKSITSDSFEIEYEEEYYDCKEDGNAEKKVSSWSEDASYMIIDGVLSFKFDYDDRWLDFNGTSDKLIGKWTRKKDTNVSCRDRFYNGDYLGYLCDEGYDITKAVFTENTVEFTRDACLTEKMKDGYVHENGMKTKVIDCNSVEFSKGSDVVKISYNSNADRTVSYKGKSCKEPPEHSFSDAQKACKDAYNKVSAEGSNSKGLDYYYYDALEKEYNVYNECVNNLLPPNFFGNDDEEEEDPDMLEKANILLKKSKNSAFRK